MVVLDEVVEVWTQSQFARVWPHLERRRV